MKPLKQYEETLEFICRCSVWAAWATFQMSKQWFNSSIICHSISQSTMFTVSVMPHNYLMLQLQDHIDGSVTV